MNKGKHRILSKTLKALAALSFFMPVVLAGIVSPQAATAAENFDAQVGEHELCLVLLVDELGVGANGRAYVPCSEVTSGDTAIPDGTTTTPDTTTPPDDCLWEERLNNGGDCLPDTEEEAPEQIIVVTTNSGGEPAKAIEGGRVGSHNDIPINRAVALSSEEKIQLGYTECSGGTTLTLTESCNTPAPPSGGNRAAICAAADARALTMNDAEHGDYFYKPRPYTIESETTGDSTRRTINSQGNRVYTTNYGCKTLSSDDLYRLRYVGPDNVIIDLDASDPQNALLNLAARRDLGRANFVGQYARLNTTCKANQAFLGMVIRTLDKVVGDFGDGTIDGSRFRAQHKQIQFRVCVYSKEIAMATPSLDHNALEVAVRAGLDQIFIEEDTEENCIDATAHEMAPSATRMDRENHVRMHDGYCGHEPGCISADAEGHDSIKQNADQMAAHEAMDMNKHGGRCEHIHPVAVDLCEMNGTYQHAAEPRSLSVWGSGGANVFFDGWTDPDGDHQFYSTDVAHADYCGHTHPIPTITVATWEDFVLTIKPPLGRWNAEYSGFFRLLDADGNPANDVPVDFVVHALLEPGVDRVIHTLGVQEAAYMYQAYEGPLDAYLHQTGFASSNQVRFSARSSYGQNQLVLVGPERVIPGAKPVERFYIEYYLETNPHRYIHVTFNETATFVNASGTELFHIVFDPEITRGSICNGNAVDTDLCEPTVAPPDCDNPPTPIPDECRSGIADVDPSRYTTRDEIAVRATAVHHTIKNDIQCASART